MAKLKAPYTRRSGFSDAQIHPYKLPLLPVEQMVGRDSIPDKNHPLIAG